MKKFICLAMAMVMAASMFTACGCMRDAENRTESMITEATGMVPHVTTTVPIATTEHNNTTGHTYATQPSTAHTGDGIIDGTEHTGTTGTTGMTGRSANMP